MDWASLHQQELLEAFNRAAALQAPGKIAPLELSGHMNHLIYRITSVECIAPYTLRLRSDCGDLEVAAPSAAPPPFDIGCYLTSTFQTPH